MLPKFILLFEKMGMVTEHTISTITRRDCWENKAL